MARHPNRRPGMRPSRQLARQARAAGGSPPPFRPAAAIRVGRPPGMPEVCRRYLARQAVGLLPTETVEDE
jgi:hypothetical protein